MSLLHTFLKTTITFAIVTLIISVPSQPVLAETDWGPTLDLGILGTTIAAIEAWLTGPVARVVAFMSIVGGAIAVHNGREMHEAVKIIGALAVTLGILWLGTSFIPGLSAPL